MAATAVTVVITRCATSMASPPTPTNTSPCQNWPVNPCHTSCTPLTDPSLVRSFSASLTLSVWPPTVCLTVPLCHPISSLSHCVSVLLPASPFLTYCLSLCASPLYLPPSYLVKVCVAYLTPCLHQPFPRNIDDIRAAESLRLTARLRTVGYVADEKTSACCGHVCTPHPQF